MIGPHCWTIRCRGKDGQYHEIVVKGGISEEQAIRAYLKSFHPDWEITDMSHPMQNKEFRK